MTYTNSVGAPQAYYPTYQAQAPVQTYGAAPTQAYGADAYQARYAPQPMGAAPQQKEPYAVLNKTDMMLGVGGAVAGFFLAGMIGLTGPIGALIFGLGLMALSAGVRGIKHMSEKNQQQQQMQAVHPGFQQNYQAYQPAYQNYYGPNQTSMAPTQPGSPQYQYPQGYSQQGAYPGAYPQQKSMWDKFLSWL